MSDDTPRLRGHGDPPPLPDPAAALAGALSRPLGLPALPAFVEPGDRVTVVVDEGLPGAREWVLPLVEESLGRAAPSRIDVLAGAGEFLALGKVQGVGVFRVDRIVAEADKLIWLSALFANAEGGVQETAARLVAACSGQEGIGSPVAPEGAGSGTVGPAAGGEGPGGAQEGAGTSFDARALASMLDLLPPVFLVEVAFQRGVRPAALFAGGIREAHRAAVAFQRRWPGAAL